MTPDEIRQTIDRLTVLALVIDSTRHLRVSKASTSAHLQSFKLLIDVIYPPGVDRNRYYRELASNHFEPAQERRATRAQRTDQFVRGCERLANSVRHEIAQLKAGLEPARASGDVLAATAIVQDVGITARPVYAVSAGANMEPPRIVDLVAGTAADLAPPPHMTSVVATGTAADLAPPPQMASVAATIGASPLGGGPLGGIPAPITTPPTASTAISSINSSVSAPTPVLLSPEERAELMRRLVAMGPFLEQIRPLLEQLERWDEQRRHSVGGNYPPDALPFGTKKLDLTLAADSTLRVRLSSNAADTQTLGLVRRVFEQARDEITAFGVWIGEWRNEIAIGLLLAAASPAVSMLPGMLQQIIDILQQF